MTDRSRRRLIKGLAAGGGIATVVDHWFKPVVDSVVLPVHAQTSGAVYSGTGLSDSGITMNDGQSKRLIARLTDAVVPRAEAQAGGLFYACASVSGSSAFVAVTGLSNDQTPGGVLMIRRGTLDLPMPMGNGQTGVISARGSDVAPCFAGDPGDRDRQARITSITDLEIVIEILTDCGEAVGPLCAPGQFLQLAVPRTNSCLPEPPVYQGNCSAGM